MDDEERHTPQINGGPLTDEGRQTGETDEEDTGTHEKEEQEVSF